MATGAPGLRCSIPIAGSSASTAFLTTFGWHRRKFSLLIYRSAWLRGWPPGAEPLTVWVGYSCPTANRCKNRRVFGAHFGRTGVSDPTRT